MHNRKILIIGEVYVDQHLDIIENGYSTSRLGGIFHAARSCDALNIEYALAYYAPDYLVKDVEKFGIDVLRASSIFRLGKVDKAPNVMLIGQSDESGNQLYENILGRQAEYVSMLPFMQVLDDFDPTDIIIFPGRYGNAGILSNLSNYEGKIHIDMNYDCSLRPTAATSAARYRSSRRSWPRCARSEAHSAAAARRTTCPSSRSSATRMPVNRRF